MKPSKYNYFLPWSEDRTLFFNGLTKRFFFVSPQNKEIFIDVIQDPDKNEENYKPFIYRMMNEGFIVNDTTNELEKIEEQFDILRSPNSYMIMILPTYQCNVRCWYCIQEHADMTISVETVNRIKRHIERYLKGHKEIEHLQISWFGGEPTLRFDVINDINKFAIDFCENLNINFSSGITSNGTLLNEEKILKLRELKVFSFQFTIDGTEDKHNQVKNLKNKSAFKITLSNICHIINLIPEASCTLRINYTPDSLDPANIIADVNKVIPKELRSRITIFPVKVWQISPDDVDYDKVNELCLNADCDGYDARAQLPGMCYVANHHFNCFFPNGKVGKCDNENPNKANGTINENGEIIWHTEYSFLKKSLFDEDSVCRECKHLPFCYGPCPDMQNKQIGESGNIQCVNNNERIHSAIYDYVKNILMHTL